MGLTPEQNARENLVKRLRDDANALKGEKHQILNLQGLRIDLDQAANEIEDLGMVYEAASVVFDVGARKGMLFVTDEETRSDKLIGFFIPAYLINKLGDALKGRV